MAQVQLLVASQAVLLEQANPLVAAWLSPDEQQRWYSLTTELRQREFLASRIGIRHVLALSGWRPERMNLSARAGSGPRVLSDSNKHSVPLLSLSHSQHYIACVSAPFPIGVDLEVLPSKRLKNIHELADFVCSPAERLMLGSASMPVEQTTLFVKFWVLKESWFKSLGTGIDFQRIKQISCCMTSVIPAGARVVGYAYLWEGRDLSFRQLIWALCTSRSLPVQDMEVTLPDGLHLSQAQSWSLLEFMSDV